MNERDLFTEALDRTDPADRAAFLDQACEGDPACAAGWRNCSPATPGAAARSTARPSARGVAETFTGRARPSTARRGRRPVLPTRRRLGGAPTDATASSTRRHDRSTPTRMPPPRLGADERPGSRRVEGIGTVIAGRYTLRRGDRRGRHGHRSTGPASPSRSGARWR